MSCDGMRGIRVLATCTTPWWPTTKTATVPASKKYLKKAQRFSWWMTTMLNTFPEPVTYDQNLQGPDLAYLFSPEKALSRWRRTM